MHFFSRSTLSTDIQPSWKTIFAPEKDRDPIKVKVNKRRHVTEHFRSSKSWRVQGHIKAKLNKRRFTVATLFYLLMSARDVILNPLKIS